MVNHHNSLALSGSQISDPYTDLGDSDSDDCNIGNFEDMTFEELDRLFVDNQSSPSNDELPFESVDPSSQNIPPHSSLSPADTEAQFTPASSGYDLRSDESNIDEVPVDFVTQYTNSPNEAFEQISPYSSRSDDYSHIGQSVPRSTYGSSPSATRSRESTSAIVSDLTQQQWPSFNTLASDDTLASSTNDQLEIQYQSFDDSVPMSMGAPSSNNLFGTTLPLRPVHYSQPWAPMGLQSNTYVPSWGSFHEPPSLVQNEPIAQFISPYMQAAPRQIPPEPQTHHARGFPLAPTPSYDLTNNNLRPLQLSHSHHDGQQHEPSTQASICPQVHNETANLSVSTRYRYPHHPAIIAERQSPASAKQKPRQIAVANLEDIPITARPRDPQTNKPKHGGRKKNTHLNQDARERSSKMRKKGACWRCKLQRDPVSRCRIQF